MNVTALKAQIVLSGTTVAKLAREIGVSASSFYKKINSKSEFTQSEIRNIAKTLHLSAHEILDIFFNENVS